jgi:hypothetical protein
VGSVADQRAGLARLSTAPSVAAPSVAAPSVAAPSATSPSLAAAAGVTGGVLLVAAMVAAGFRARARLGRLG